MITKTCERCGESFDAYHPKKQRFCSKACQRKAWKGPKRKWERAPKAAQCETCKSEYKPRNTKQRFCSRDCLYESLRGDTGPAWKGGRVVNSEGYVSLHTPDHPSVQERRSGHKYVAEHRLVMEAHLGRFLEDYETVHHINGNTSDNRIENLQMRTGKHGKGIQHLCGDCGSRNILSESI